MFEHGRAIVRQMFIKLACVPGAPASWRAGSIDQFVSPQIVALKLDQIESDERDVMIPATAPQRIEIGNAIVAANDGLALDQEGWRPQAAGGLHDAGKTIGPIIPAARPQAHPRAFTAHVLGSATLATRAVASIGPTQRQNMATLQLSADHHLATGINSMNLEDRLGDVRLS